MNLLKLRTDSGNEDPFPEIRLPRAHSRTIPATLLLYLAPVLCIALLVRSYTIGLGLPYFYNEDEAHHFNRVVEMVQRGDYNPQYFHKPSMHFYLRMPVVAASFLWTVKNGHIRSIHDVKTRDQFGLSGYSLTASHPGIVKWNRALSVLFSLGIVLTAGLITYLLTGSSWFASLGALLAGVSPGLIEYSGVIGVDMPTAFFCSSAVFFALWFQRTNSLWLLIGSCALAGFAVSTKYNALPVAIVPFLAVLLSAERSLVRSGISLLLPGVCFFAASPFILVSLPLFLDHFAYEIWHYGQAAHAGHSAKPGLDQAVFYGSWLARDGISLVGSLLLLAAIPLLFLKNRSEAIVALAFPVLYFGLMVSQKTHFERNMLMLLGVLPALVTYTLWRLHSRPNPSKRKTILLSLFILAILLPGFSKSLKNRSEALRSDVDSRNIAFSWLEKNTPTGIDTALQGELLLPSFTSYAGGIPQQSVPGIKRIDFMKYTILDLFQKGYSRVVVGPEYIVSSEALALFKLEKEFSGQSELGRIPGNPAMRVYDLNLSVLDAPAELLSELIKANTRVPELNLECGSAEDHCWATARLSKVSQPSSSNYLVSSPWGSQEITFFSPSSTEKHVFSVTEEPTEITIPSSSTDWYLLTPEVHVPAHRSKSSDTRRLGVAFKVVQ